jgi:hypothetical protein
VTLLTRVFAIGSFPDIWRSASSKFWAQKRNVLILKKRVGLHLGNRTLLLRLHTRVWKLYTWYETTYIPSMYLYSGYEISFRYLKCKKIKFHLLIPGPNPTIVSYNPSVVNFYNSTNSLVGF